MPAIDDLLPRFDFREAHSIALTVAPERALELALAAPAAPDPIVRVLFRLRGLRPSGTIEEAFGGIGFDVLARSPRGIVVGAAGTPWRRGGGMRPLAEAAPGTVRIATDFRAQARAGGCTLTTETRILAADASAFRAFRRYWRVVRPFSAVIRRRWLAAAGRSL